MKISSSLTRLSPVASYSSSGADNFLDIDRIRANPLYTCYVTLPNGRVLTGLVDSGNTFEISTGIRFIQFFFSKMKGKFQIEKKEKQGNKQSIFFQVYE